MKNVISLVIALMIASSSLLGQSLPSSVDNSAFVPPVIVQYWNSCQTVSVAYYLKSYLWNREFNRNPSLPENQFNPYFVWNQNVIPVGHYTTTEPSVQFMSNQGCGTVDMFPLPDNPPFEYQEVMPSKIAREKALSFRSRELKKVNIWAMDSLAISAQITKLKDSLSRGVCFALSFPIFDYINQLYVQSGSPAIYKCFPGVSNDSMLATHQAMVVGYDDNLQAFKLVNSWGIIFGDQGYFYLDYKWFFWLTTFSYDIFFLYEDFGHQAEVTVNMPISGYVNGEDRLRINNLIIDTVYWHSGMVRWYDFLNSYAVYYPNLIRLQEVNGQRVSVEHTNIFIPEHNHDGYYQVIEDITNYSSADSFRSASILVMDPISGVFNTENGVLYQYARESWASINGPYIKLMHDSKVVVGRVASLGDTTVIKNNYWSNYLYYHSPGLNEVYITSSTCTFKRYLVTFDIADTTINAPPVIIAKPDTLKTKPDSMVTFQFSAQDPDGDSLRYSVSGEGATINPITGLFQYRSSSLGSYDIKVYVSDGYNAVQDSFIVKVDNTVGVEDEDGSLPTKYSLSQNYPNPFNPSTVINFSVPKTGQVILKVYNILGQEITTLVNEEITVGSHSVRFDGSGLSSGLYLYSIEAENYRETKKMVLVK